MNRRVERWLCQSGPASNSDAFCVWQLFINPVNPRHIPGSHRRRERCTSPTVCPLCVRAPSMPSGSVMALTTAARFCWRRRSRQKAVFHFSPRTKRNFCPFFLVAFKLFFCCWLLPFYDRCLWSSMTHVNGKAWVLGSAFCSLNVGLLLTPFLFQLQQLICLRVRMSRTSSSKWKTLSHFPGKPFKTSTEQPHFQGFLISPLL